MIECPLCGIEVEDVPNHLGGYRTTPCVVAKAVLGPPETSRVRVKVARPPNVLQPRKPMKVARPGRKVFYAVGHKEAS